MRIIKMDGKNIILFERDETLAADQCTLTTLDINTIPVDWQINRLTRQSKGLHQISKTKKDAERVFLK